MKLKKGDIVKVIEDVAMFIDKGAVGRVAKVGENICNGVGMWNHSH